MYSIVLDAEDENRDLAKIEPYEADMAGKKLDSALVKWWMKCAEHNLEVNKFKFSLKLSTFSGIKSSLLNTVESSERAYYVDVFIEIHKEATKITSSLWPMRFYCGLTFFLQLRQRVCFGVPSAGCARFCFTSLSSLISRHSR